MFYSVVIGKETAYVDLNHYFLLYTRCWCVSSCTKILTLAFIHEEIQKYLDFYEFALVIRVFSCFVCLFMVKILFH